MFSYLSKHYDAESGEVTGNKVLAEIGLRLDRCRWWLRKDVVSTMSRAECVWMAFRVLFMHAGA